MRQFLASLKSAVGTVQTKLDPNTAQAKVAGQSPGTGTPTQQPDAIVLQLLRNVRNKLVRKQFLDISKDEYTENKEICIVAGTYNLNGKKPPPDTDLAEWLGTLRDDWPSGCSGPDIVAVGFQEIVPLSAGNVLAGGNSEDVEAWDQLLAAALNGQEWATRQFRRSTSTASLAQDGSSSGTFSHSQATPQSIVGAGYKVITEQASGLIDGVNKMWSGGPRGTATADLLHFLSMESGELTEDREEGEGSTIEARRDDFIQLAAKQLVGVYLSVWVRKSMLRHISGVQTTSVATGFGGLLGNKGAAVMRMRLYDSPLCFVCSHFQSGDSDGDEVKRNADFADIIRRSVFPSEADLSAKNATDALSLLSAALGPGHWGEKRGILDHDNIIWVGDLNYRLTMPDDEVRRLLRSNRIAQLLEADQLLRELEAGRVFQGWKEGPIKFLPTFKYRLGTNTYVGEPLPSTASLAAIHADQDAESDTDQPTTPQPEDAPANPTHAGEKRRTPAWCDRVLWLTGSELKQLGYRRGELTASDHRPVAAAFTIAARHYKRDVVEALIERERRKVDLSEMARRPKCTLEPNSIVLEDVALYQHLSLSVTLSNTGTVDAFFHFVALPAPSKNQHRVTMLPLAPRWLTVAPEEGQVAAGDSTEIKLTVEVRGGPDGSADHLSQKPGCPMDAILILRVEDAMDHFISVTGQFIPSAFGLAFTTLATYGERPVRPRSSSATPTAAAAEAGAEHAINPADSTMDAMLAYANSANSPPSTASTLPGRKESMSQALTERTSGGSISLPQEGFTGAQVPKEVQALTQYLMAEDRLGTSGLFLASTEIAVRLASGGTTVGQAVAVTLERVLEATKGLRASLDAGEGVAEGTSSHLVAAALLLLFQELPSPFMPVAAAEAAVCGEPVPPGAALDLLDRHMPPVEFAVLHNMLHMARRALEPERAERSGVEAASLAALLAEHWFLPLPPGVSKLAEASTVTAGRVAFVLTLLQGADPSQVLQLPMFDSVDAIKLGTQDSEDLLL